MTDFTTLWEIASGRPAPRLTPIEKLQAAIDKLEMLKRESTPAAWFLTYERSTHPSIWGNADADDADLVARTMRDHRDAELIVTLHRSIDAQLDVLRSAADFLTKGGTEWPSPVWDAHPELRDALSSLLRHEIGLADAILGGGPGE